MLALIIHGSSRSFRRQYILSAYPRETHSHIHIESSTSIQIKQIHDMRSSTTLIPINNRLVWLEEANLMTIPAQNALLKILEEPPAKTQFILSLNNPTNLLPTILSRCRTIPIKNQTPNILDDSSLKTLKEAMQKSPAERIVLSGSLPRKRDELLVWFDSVINSLSEKTKQTKITKQLRVLSSILLLATKAQNQLKSNCNTTLVITNFFLKLPRLN